MSPRPDNADKDGSVESYAFTGLNNRERPERIGLGALNKASNVDLDGEGRITRRPGFTTVYSGAGIHSLWSGGDYLLCVEGTQLKQLTVGPSGSITGSAIGSGFMPGRHLAYDLLNSEVYLSNGVITGKVTADGLIPWGVQTPARQPTLTADTVGGLHAGTYQVAVTFVTGAGEESGSPTPQEIVVSEGGGILLTLLPQPTEANVATVRIYVSPPNEDVLYLASEVAAGATAAYVYRWDTGMSLQTLHLEKMPPSNSIAHLGGRIYGALGNVLYWTESLRYGLYRPTQNWMPFPGADLKAVAAVEGAGLYVIGEKTWYLAGTEPSAFVQTEVLGYGGPQQQILRVPREAFTGLEVGIADVPVWLSDRGFHAGLPGGVLNLTEKTVVVDSYKRIAALYREQNGRRQVVATGANPQRAAFAMGDTAIAEVRRNGIVI